MSTHQHGKTLFHLPSAEQWYRVPLLWWTWPLPLLSSIFFQQPKCKNGSNGFSKKLGSLFPSWNVSGGTKMDTASIEAIQQLKFFHAPPTLSTTAGSARLFEGRGCNILTSNWVRKISFLLSIAYPKKVFGNSHKVKFWFFVFSGMCLVSEEIEARSYWVPKFFFCFLFLWD